MTVEKLVYLTYNHNGYKTLNSFFSPIIIRVLKNY
jgi:hypothetical protein